eukprot:403347561
MDSDSDSQQDNQEKQQVIQRQPTPIVPKKQAIKNWMQFDMSEELAESLVANQFVQPTDVQAQSLVFLNAHVDMVIAAKTGQGKTLTFGIPILDLLIKRLIKDQSGEPEEFTSIKALIMSPTRELAIQIKDHIQAVVPVQYQNKIKLCPLVGGMSIQKQERLLSYNPTIVIATPGRLWELLNERMNPYLQSALPMIDVLVLDEADRMIEDGHFKEMKYILDYVYSKRVEFKKLKLLREKNLNADETDPKVLEQKKMKKDIIDRAKSQKDNMVIKTIETNKNIKFDMNKVVDLYDESEMLEEIDPDELIVEDGHKNDEEKEEGKGKGKKQKRLSQQQLSKEQEEKFAAEYKKMGGIQHIICSATMTIDPTGRITPKKAKKILKSGHNKPEAVDTLEQLCKTLRFRTKTPKVIDLTEEERMPETLKEYALKCEQKEKDLYVYYFMKQKMGESCIIFSNSITCTKRVSSLLTFLKIPNHCLHSKMQQRQRLKNLDRFKQGVQAIENGSSTKSSVLVCTDVAARGLDIPYVQNILHYQCPFNAEIYIHRCGRTARIGRSGDSLSLLAAEDEKNFKIIRKVLKKDVESVQMFPVSYYQLNKLEPLVEAAKQFEGALHRKTKEEKSTSWMLKLAKSADLDLDDEDEKTLREMDGENSIKSKKKKGKREVKAPVDIFDKDLEKMQRSLDDTGARHKTKAVSKVQQMKERYDDLKKQENFKKVSNSSFLTPEAASYLNEIIKKGQSQVDNEIVYAGMHSDKSTPLKFKRKEKFTSRYKKRTKSRGKNRK